VCPGCAGGQLPRVDGRQGRGRTAGGHPRQAGQAAGAPARQAVQAAACTHRPAEEEARRQEVRGHREGKHYREYIVPSKYKHATYTASFERQVPSCNVYEMISRGLR
jgi:hypothetical protein